MTWEEAVALASAQPGAERSTYYGQPAVKANGRAFLNAGHEAATSFCLHLDRDTAERLLATRPDTFFQTPHYAGHPVVLVRHDTDEDALVGELIARAAAQARARPAPRPRRR